MFRLLVGDEVQVTAGNHKGMKGRILRLDNERGRVIVEGVNLKKRHLAPTAQTTGGIVEIPHGVNVSNVMPLDPKSGKPTRVKFEERDGQKVRIAASSGEIIPVPEPVAQGEAAEA